MKLDLKPQAVIVYQLVVNKFQITTKQDYIDPGIRLQIDSEQNNDIQKAMEGALQNSHRCIIGLVKAKFQV